jgi:hypothetical protein
MGGGVEAKSLRRSSAADIESVGSGGGGIVFDIINGLQTTKTEWAGTRLSSEKADFSGVLEVRTRA